MIYDILLYYIMLCYIIFHIQSMILSHALFLYFSNIWQIYLKMNLNNKYLIFFHICNFNLFYGSESKILSGSSLVPLVPLWFLWFLSGSSLVLLWFISGSSLVPLVLLVPLWLFWFLWFLSGSSLVPLWFLSGSSLVPFRAFRAFRAFRSDIVQTST